MSLFNFYDLPYESAVKILQKVDFPTTVNFYKASIYSNSIIEANCSLEKMEEEEKKKRNVGYFGIFPGPYPAITITLGGYSEPFTFINSVTKYLSSGMWYEECPISSIEEDMLYSFNPFYPHDEFIVSKEEIKKKVDEKIKALIEQNSQYKECPISSIEKAMLPSFNPFYPHDEFIVSSEEIEKKANEKNKTLIKEKKKARRTVKERPVKHQFRRMNPRGKSFNFHQ